MQMMANMERKLAALAMACDGSEMHKWELLLSLRPAAAALSQLG